MLRDELLHLLAHAAAPAFGAVAVDQHRQGVDRFGIDQDRHLDQVAGLVVLDLVVERGVALGDRFQAVVEVEHHLVERQLIDQHGAIADIAQLALHAATVLAQLDDAAQIVVRGEDRRLDPGLQDGLDVHRVGHVGGVVEFDLRAVAHLDLVDHRGGGRDQVEVELAAQALLDDFQVQQAQESAAEAEAQGGRAFHLVGEAAVVQAQLADRGAQVLEVGGVDREQAAEDDGLDVLEAGQGLFGGLLLVGDGVADGGVGHFLDLGGDEADLAGAEALDGGIFGLEDADPVDQVGRAVLHHLDLLAGPQAAVDHADQNHDAQIGVVPGVDQQGLQRRVLVALGRRQAGDDGFQHLVDADARLGAGQHRVAGVQADQVLDLGAHALGLGGRQVDLVEDRDDLVVVVDGRINVGQRLGFHALAGVDDQDRAFAGGQRARDFIGEVDVAGGVHQIEDIGLAVVGLVVQTHGLGLDGDPAFLLDVHVVQDLGGHLTRGEAAGLLDQAVGQGALAVVDVGHDGEVADQVQGRRSHGRASSIFAGVREGRSSAHGERHG